MRSEDARLGFHEKRSVDERTGLAALCSLYGKSGARIIVDVSRCGIFFRQSKGDQDAERQGERTGLDNEEASPPQHRSGRQDRLFISRPDRTARETGGITHFTHVCPHRVAEV